MTKCVVFYSGGLASYAAAERAIQMYGKGNTVLSFTDTKTEDEDLYRFLKKTQTDLDVPLVWLADSRDIWQVFRDERRLGSSRADPCSKILKRAQGDRWLKANRDPADTVLVFGIDWTEKHRYDDGKGRGLKHRWAERGWTAIAPLTEPPFLWRQDIIAGLATRGIEPPRLYALGFAHNNCGGGCVKAGIGHFAHLLRALPEVYAKWEHEEAEFNRMIRAGKSPVAMLSDRRGGRRVPYTLAQLRADLDAGRPVKGLDDVGGCGCFIED